MPRPRLIALWDQLVAAGLATEVLEPQRGVVTCTQCGHTITHDRARAASTQRGRAQMFGHLLNAHQAAYTAALEAGQGHAVRAHEQDDGRPVVHAAVE